MLAAVRHAGGGAREADAVRETLALRRIYDVRFPYVRFPHYAYVRFPYHAVFMMCDFPIMPYVRFPYHAFVRFPYHAVFIMYGFLVMPGFPIMPAR
jgi:hypothetical protein